MFGRNLEKAVIRRDQRQGQLSGQLMAEPEELRLSILKALLTLSDEERDLMRDRLLSGLERSGLHIGACLLLLGIPARTTDEVLPNDLAKLIRFVRINNPEVMRAIAAPLAALQTRPFQTENLARAAGRAA